MVALCGINGVETDRRGDFIDKIKKFIDEMKKTFGSSFLFHIFGVSVDVRSGLL